MRYFFVVSHAYFAQGIVSSVEMILGRQPNLSAYCAYVDEQGDQFVENLKRDLDALTPEDEAVVITDLFGGSVNNEVQGLLLDSRVHIVTGMNLILLITLLLAEESLPVEQAIEEGLQAAREGVKYCNLLHRKITALADEDF